MACGLMLPPKIAFYPRDAEYTMIFLSVLCISEVLAFYNKNKILRQYQEFKK